MSGSQKAKTNRNAPLIVGIVLTSVVAYHLLGGPLIYASMSGRIPDTPMTRRMLQFYFLPQRTAARLLGDDSVYCRIVGYYNRWWAHQWDIDVIL